MKTAVLVVAVVLTMACSTSSQPNTSAPAKLPPARGYHYMVGLGTNPGILLFSGETAPPRFGGYDLGDVWLWRTGGGWTQKSGLGQKYGCPVLAPATRPCRSSDFACYDPKAGRMVVLATDAGQDAPLAENWTYDPLNDAWHQRAVDQRPEFPNGTTAALDNESDRVIAFDGETWAYDPAANAWLQMHPKNSPQFGSFSAFVYDEKQDRLILLGGEFRGPLRDVWTYDFNHDAWTEADAGSGPSGRLYTAVAYDARSGSVILFGGIGSNPLLVSSEPPLNDTWSYDLRTNKWTELKPKTSPPARGRHAMAFDSESGKIVMFGGGVDPRNFKNDTWIFDPSTSNWTKA
jgi:N-acetylneuraminic acid mutarotase